MPAIINHAKCRSCQACKQVCPFDAIQWDQYNAVPIVNDDCMECGACVYACPADAIEIMKPQATIDTRNQDKP